MLLPPALCCALLQEKRRLRNLLSSSKLCFPSVQPCRLFLKCLTFWLPGKFVFCIQGSFLRYSRLTYRTFLFTTMEFNQCCQHEHSSSFSEDATKTHQRSLVQNVANNSQRRATWRGMCNRYTQDTSSFSVLYVIKDFSLSQFTKNTSGFTKVSNITVKSVPSFSKARKHFKITCPHILRSKAPGTHPFSLSGK